MNIENVVNNIQLSWCDRVVAAIVSVAKEEIFLLRMEAEKDSSISHDVVKLLLERITCKPQYIVDVLPKRLLDKGHLFEKEREMILMQCLLSGKKRSFLADQLNMSHEKLWQDVKRLTKEDPDFALKYIKKQSVSLVEKLEIAHIILENFPAFFSRRLNDFKLPFNDSIELLEKIFLVQPLTFAFCFENYHYTKEQKKALLKRLFSRYPREVNRLRQL